MAQQTTLDPPLPTELIYQFPHPTWIENLAIRKNGQILVTILTTPELFLVDPSNAAKGTLVHKFPDILGLTGIIEVKEDVFYVAGGNFNLSEFSNEQGSYTVWEVDLTSFDTNSEAKVRKVTKIAESGLLNGMAYYGALPDTILIADSEVGAVWGVNVHTGKYEIMVQVDEMKPPPPPGMQMGINGIDVRDGYLYWTNTAKELVCRIKIDGEGKATANAEAIASNCLVDDFTFDRKGQLWLAQNFWNTVAVINLNGEVLGVAGNKDQLTVAGGTSCQFGRTVKDQRILYVATSGGLASPVNGVSTEGGKVVAIDTSKFGS
jgi:uncharacterized protein YunC (DUF1805 family)